MTLQGDWWTRGAPFCEDSSISSTQISAGAVTSTKVASAVLGYIPGTATIRCSSHSSDNFYYAQIRLYDAGGNAWTRRQHVRVYLQGTTGDAGDTVASTVPTALDLQTTATTAAIGTWDATSENVGIQGSTHTAQVDREFITTSDGYLNIAMTMGAAGASTYYLVVDWQGGVVKSSAALGSTVAAT